MLQSITCRRLTVHLLRLTIFTGKVLDSYILDRYLLQKVRTLAARVTSDDAFAPQPITKPSQVTVTVERIGQKVAGEQREESKVQRCFFCLYICIHLWVCVSYFSLTVWTGSAMCQRPQGSWRWSGCRRVTGDALNSTPQSCCYSHS